MSNIATVHGHRLSPKQAMSHGLTAPQVLEIVPLHLDDWLLVAGVALGLLVVVEIGKAISNYTHRAAAMRDTTKV